MTSLMVAPSTYGYHNAHSVGIVLKEAVRRAAAEIRRVQRTFEAEEKVTPGCDYDIVTSADRAAQALYLRVLRECFPSFGIIGEEDGLNEPCTLEGLEYYFVLDPLDGTKAFARRQAGDFATQIALVQVREDGSIEVLAAFVCDIISGEVFGYRPESTKVHRIYDLAESDKLSELDRSRPLADSYAILRQHPEAYGSSLVCRLLRPQSRGGLFRNIMIPNGSASLTAARAWKGEAAVHVSGGFRDCPWDVLPVVGIYRKLGFVSLVPDPAENRFMPYDYQLSLEPCQRAETVLWVHQQHVTELNAWAAAV